MPEVVRPEVTRTSILLVEDNRPLLACLDAFFRESGFSTATASTNREAWQQIRTHPPDVCVLDVNLPDGSGLDLFKRIASQYPATRVVIMTALPLENLRTRYNRPNLAGWLTKPVTPEKLLDVVEKAAGNMTVH